MNQSDADAAVRDYLARLKKASKGLPRSDRLELLADIEQHIIEARVGLSTEANADIHDILRAIGQPSDIATEAALRSRLRTIRRKSSVPLYCRRAALGLAIAAVLLIVSATALPWIDGETTIIHDVKSGQLIVWLGLLELAVAIWLWFRSHIMVAITALAGSAVALYVAAAVTMYYLSSLWGVPPRLHALTYVTYASGAGVGFLAALAMMVISAALTAFMAFRVGGRSHGEPHSGLGGPRPEGPGGSGWSLTKPGRLKHREISELDGDPNGWSSPEWSDTSLLTQASEPPARQKVNGTVR